MKFYCDSCNTKYGIADEKVRGKVLKVRCKKCGNVITVREQSVPTQQPSAPAPPPAPSRSSFDPSTVDWHYSLNGQSFGPFAFAALEQRFASGELGDECYVWTDSFSGWKPVREVDAFKSALQKGQRIKPRRNTIGVSQALEAIKPEDFEKAKQQAKAQRAEQNKRAEKDERAEQEREPAQPAESEQSQQPQKADEPEEPKTPASAAEAADEAEDDGQKDRLAKLRARLKSSKGSATPQPASDADEPGADEDSPAEPASDLDDDLVADGGSAQASSTADVEPSADESPEEELSDDGPDALGPTLPMDGSSGPDSFGGTEDEDEGESSGLFADFDAAQQPAGADEAEDSDHIPFLAGGPELGSDSEKVGAKGKKKEAEGITGSLLIQLDSIQKEGRGKKVLLVAVALLVVGGLTATAIYMAGQVEPEEKVAKSDAAEDDQDDELVFRTYSDDEQNKILTLDSQEVGKNEGKEEAKPEKQPTKVASNQKTGASKKRVRGPKIKDDGPSLEDALNSSKKKGASTDKFRKGLDDGAVAKTELDSPIAGNSDSFNALGALATDRKDSIYRPTDAVKKRKQNTGGGMKLSRKQINQGIRTVRRSVGICRQRHSRRGAPLDARKIYLTITVEPGGRVSKFSLAPDRIRHTEFERCMNSHRGRWKFPSFDGSAQTMRAPFVLQ